MSSTKWTQIENIQFKFTKHFDTKYSHAQNEPTIAYYNQVDYIEYLFLYDNRTAIASGSNSMIKGK